MPLTPAEAAQRVHQLADELGFGLCGITAAEPTDHADHIRRWLAAGSHGEMHYLANHLETRLDPRRLLDGARSIIAAADFYPSRPTPQVKPRDSHPSASGRIARYAWGDDYHKIIKKRLHRLADALREQLPHARFKCVVDTAPALEREHAMRAGLGWTGKHTLLIHPHLGSWMLLGLIVTDLELPTEAEQGYPGRSTPATDHCGTCTRCIDACPTGCIEDPADTGRRSIDASRCISYLTLEHRSPIEPDLHPAMGDWIAGCDVCQEVCPFNRRHDAEQGGTPPDSAAADPRHTPPAMHPRYRPRKTFARGLPLLEVLGWTPEDRQAAFVSSALKRVRLDMLKRNALIVAGNHLAKKEAPQIRERIEAIARDESEPELVRATANQVLARLAKQER